jgi:hypothetical protein
VNNSSSLVHRLSALRWELECVLNELNIVRVGGTDAGKQFRELQERLGHATHHLEMALDYLDPPTSRSSTAA